MAHGSESDEVPIPLLENPIKYYLEKIMKVVVNKYSEPFPWGNLDINLSLWERIDMGIARLLWF